MSAYPFEAYRRALAREVARSIDEKIMQPLDAAEADRLIRESGSSPPRDASVETGANGEGTE